MDGNVIARIWEGAVVQAIRTANLPKQCRLKAIYFRYGSGQNDWYSGAH